MQPTERPRHAIVLLYPGCTIAEVIELATRLADADFDVVFGAVDPAPLIDRSGLRIQPAAGVESLDPTTADAVIVPGGDPEAVIDDPAVAGLLRTALEAGGLVAGICAGVLVMAAAGVLQGRSITHNYRPPWAPPEVVAFVERSWLGAMVEPDPAVGVVVDGPIITALPNATIEFTTTVCHHLGLYDADRARHIGRHLRGEHVVELYPDHSDPGPGREEV